ncbi:shikimate dehydrogenase [Thioclava sp. GXIMD2076]|uniref:Shikimate dehydrogenase n=1 Tax=Thioclava kandeliae TaxID=3070818 RepID=A0ABV1SMA2_9RHOB
MSTTLLLGLIGDHIAASSSPKLHRFAGAQAGIEVRYDLLVPQEMGRSWDEIFASLPALGYRGTNITYPYKELVVPQLTIEDPLVQAMGACNTVRFDSDGPRGFNTDYTGFIRAYRTIRGEAAPGPVLMVGTGGVGRAVAFGLLALGAPEIRLVDRDRAKAEALARVLRSTRPDTEIRVEDDAASAASGAEGLINCTPLGMSGRGGTPLARAAMEGAQWAFDAVYTPRETEFMQSAEALGLVRISGWELFFYQGVDAWRIFSGKDVDEPPLRTALGG